MKLILLDGYDAERVEFLRTLLDPSWELTTSSHDTEQLSILLGGADAVVTQYWSSRTPPALGLKLMQLPGAGFDAIDFSQVPEHCTVSNVFEHEIGISEYIVLALLESEIKLAEMNAHLRRGRWQDGFVTGAPFHGELFGKRVGFIGYGHIAREAARRLAPFGVEVWSRTRSPEKVDALVSDAAGMDELDAMLSACRYIVVTCPLTAATRGLLDARRLALMGAKSILINVARGSVVDEEALFNALRSRTIESAVIDTWYRYPDPALGFEQRHPPSNFPFESLDNVIMTSHASGWTDALFERRFRVIAKNLEHLRKGEPFENVLMGPGGSPPG